METKMLRTWAEINLDALAHNYRQARKATGPDVKYLGVVKADAYGHGAIQVSRELERLGTDYLAVACLDEAVELRENGIKTPILILGYTPPALISDLIRYNITQTVASEHMATQYSEVAAGCAGMLNIHVKVDTGMSRLGFAARGDQLLHGVNAILRVCELPNLNAEGIFTHFSVSDEDDLESETYTKEQFEVFSAVLALLEQSGKTFSIRHCANSGALARYPEMDMDMVRPGIALYGVGADAEHLGLKPVMSLKSNISTIKELREGTDISYGRTFQTSRPSRVGVLPIGYADGLIRGLSNRLKVITSQGAVPVCGRICMDMTMIDLTDMPQIFEGSEVEIFGQKQKVDTIAAEVGSIPYELLCAVNKRVPRLYIKEGIVIERVLRIQP